MLWGFHKIYVSENHLVSTVWPSGFDYIWELMGWWWATFQSTCWQIWKPLHLGLQGKEVWIHFCSLGTGTLREKYLDNGTWLPSGPCPAGEGGDTVTGNSGRLCAKLCWGVAQRSGSNSLETQQWHCKGPFMTARTAGNQEKAKHHGEWSGPKGLTVANGCFRSKFEATLGYPQETPRKEVTSHKRLKALQCRWLTRTDAWIPCICLINI